MQTRNNLFGRHHSLLRTAVIAALLTSLPPTSKASVQPVT